MARIPNMSKVKTHSFNEPIYEVRRYKNFIEPSELSFDLSEDKSKDQFIKYIEKLARKSWEYKKMITFLREKIDMNYCAFFRKVNNKINGKMIEIHHEPFTLYDIVAIILRQYIDEGYPLDIPNIVEDTMLLHYYGMVGLIPLSKTVHELVHAGEIFVPIEYVFGDIEGFFKKYRKYMTENQKEILAKSIKVSEQLASSTPKVLQKKFIYLDVDGMVLPAKLNKKGELKKKTKKKLEKIRHVKVRRIKD